MSARCPRCNGAVLFDGYEPSCLACGHVPGQGIPPPPELEQEVRQTRYRLRPEEVKHGSMSMYKRGCHCAACKAANTADGIRRRARKLTG